MFLCKRSKCFLYGNIKKNQHVNMFQQAFFLPSVVSQYLECFISLFCLQMGILMLREIIMLCHSHHIMWFSDLQFGGVFDLEQFPTKIFQKLVDRLKRSNLDDRIN